MILAEVPSIISDVGMVVGTMTGMALLAGIASRSKFGRWLWRNLVSEPFSKWLSRHVVEAMAPLTEKVDKIVADIAPTNGDPRSISDRVDQAKKDTTAVKVELESYRKSEMIDRRERQRGLDDRMRDGAERMTHMERRQQRIEDKLDEALAGNPEVRQRRATVVTPETFDMTTAPEWTQALEQLAPDRHLTIDMAATEFCDSSGLGALAAVGQRARAAGATVRVINARPQARRVMGIVGLGELLDVDDES